MKLLDINVFRKDIITLLDESMNMVIATCINDKVTARTVYYVNQGLDIYFVTSKAYTKYKQIVKNPNIALCLNSIQMEGTAFIKGHPNLEENKDIIDYCLNKHDGFKKFIRYKNTVLIKVELSQIGIWKENGREYLDLIKNEAYRIG